MREVDRLKQFKRDYRREKKGRYKDVLDKELNDVLKLVRLGSHSEVF